MQKIYLSLLSLKDSPLSVLLTLVVFASLGYLVALHSDSFESFFNFMMPVGFLILVVLFILWLKPFVKCNKMTINNSKSSSVKTYKTFHQDIQ